MKKLLTRGLYVFAIMLFAVGGIFMFNLNSSTKMGEIETEGETLSQSVDIDQANTWKKWNEGVSTQLNPFTTQTYFGESVNVIDSAEDLAALSYYVQSGNTTYASAYYLVTADINLIGKLWTPIGTSSTPFSGQFYGGGHTISGIVVSEASSVSGSGVGLFGNVTGSLVDVVVDDLVVLNQSDASMTGALAGHLSAKAEVLNCYDLRANKSVYSSIGTAISGAKIYRGGSVDGVSADYTSQTAIYNAMTINTGGNTASTRYVVQYKVTAGNARFEKYGDSAWGTSGSDSTKTKVVKVAVENYNSTSATAVEAFAFSDNIPVLRYQAEGKNGQVYVINEEYRASISQNSVSKGLVNTITFSKISTSLTINYGYGKNDNGTPKTKTATYVVPYDRPWKQYFDLTRTGAFDLEGIYKESSYTNKFTSEYIETFANGGTATLYLKWTAKTHTMTLNIGWSGADNSWSNNGSEENTPPQSPFVNGVTFTGIGTINPTSSAGRYLYSASSTGHTAGDIIKMEFWLKDGYTFTESISHKIVNGGGTISTTSPGVQTSFRAENIDSAQKTNYTVVKGTRVASGNVAYTPYTVTFEDVVETGIITLLIRQETINVTVKDTNSNRDDFSSNVLINTGAGNATETKSFSVQAGDYFHLKINANTGYYISNISIVDSNTGENINNKFSWLKTTENGTYSVETSSGQKTYIQSYKIDAEQTAGGIQSGNLTITVTLESLPIYFNVEFDADNSTENTNNGNNFDKQGLTVNGVKNGMLSLTAKPSTSTNTGEVTFRVTENSIYEIDTMTISDGEKTWTINKTNNPNDDDDYTYVWSTNNNEATATISNFSYGITYTLKYTIKAKDYSLTGSVTIDGGAPSSDFAGYTLVFSKTENDFTSPITKAMPGDKIYWKLTMTNNLYTKRIAFSGVTVTNGASATNSTYENFTIDGSFTAGTSEVSVNVAFNTVTLTFTPSTNTMYIDNFNGEGSEVFIETNDPINKIGETALTATGHQGEYTVNVSTLTSISIYSGYYLVGWYIQNGETQLGGLFGENEAPATFFGNIFSQDEFLSAVSDGATSFDLIPIYKQKTITVTGAFAESDGLKLSNDAGSTWTGGEYTLSKTYYFIHNFSVDDEVYNFSIDISSIKENMRKAGYEQATGWNFASSTGVWTDEKPAPTNYGLAINNGADKIGASNDNIQGVDVWGSENSATLTINPVFGTKIEYNIIITGIAVNEDGEHLTASTTISVGDTITFTSEDVTSEGVYTISSKPEFSFADTPSIGHQFSSFTLKGNNSSEHEAPFTAENSNVVTLKLDISLFNTLVSESGYITDRNIFTAKTNQAPSTYKIYLGYEGGAKGDAESVDVVGLQQDDDGYYVTVTYGTNADALASFTNRITRNGYTLVGFRERVSEGGVQYATYADGAWTYEVFSPEPAEDTTVYAVWQVKDEKYVSATLEGFTPHFNENEQVVIQGTVLAGENEIANGTTVVGNGETITNVTITFADGTEFDPNVDQEVFQNGRQVALKDVRGEKTYIMIVTITDTLSANRFGTNESYTYPIKSNPASGNILANAIVVEGAQIETYYTGSSAIAETANSVRGTLAFEHPVTHKDQPVTPRLSVDDATITIDGSEFGVAEGLSAVYDFDLNEQQAKNYGITAGQGGKYLIVKEGVLDIVQIELQFNMDPKTQTGFYMEDLFHRANIGSVTAYDKYNNELVSKFNFDTHYNYVRTNSDAVASYTAKQFVIDGLTVSIGDTTVDPKNYTWTVVGTYNIDESEDVANIFTYDARYLTATNGKLNITLNKELQLAYPDATRIFNVSYQVGNGAKIAVQGSQISVADTNGNTLFTIIGNGTNDLSIAVKKNADVTFEISISGEGGDNLAFLGYFTTADISVWTSSQVAPLDTFTKEAENVYDLDLTTVSSSQQYVAVFTDARALYVFENKNNTLINSNDNPTAKIYLSSGDNVGYTYANPTMTGFTFDSWRISDSTVTANASEGESDQTFKSTGGSTPVRAIAKWILDKPVLTVFNEKIESSAYGGPDFNDFSYTIVATFENESNIATYVFTWRKGDQVLGTGETYSFGDRNTSINGIYTITVTATYVDANGVQGSNTQTQTSEPAQFEFAIYKRELHSFAFDMEKTQLELDNLVYSNTDYIDKIFVNLYMYDEHHPNDSDELYVGVSLKDLLDNLPPNNPMAWIEVTYGKENTPVTSIKNAGTYKISVKVGPYGFDLRYGKQELTLTVLQDKITLTQEDVKGLTKEFGATEPKHHTINYSINGESVPITLTRTPGESVGPHAFDDASTTNANYTIADVSGLYFVITPSTYMLQVSLDSALTYTYNQKAVATVEADYIPESEEAWFTSAGWYLFAYSEDRTLLATSKLSLTVNGVTVSTEVEHALDGFIFAPSSAGADVGTYGLADISGTSTTYTRGAEFAGSVPQESAIVVEKLVLKVTKATKEYDGEAYSTWSSAGTNEGLVIEFDPSSSILQGDTLSFRFEFENAKDPGAASVGVSEYEDLIFSNISNDNYSVVEGDNCYKAILPSTKEVELKLDQELSYVYGTLTTNNTNSFLIKEVHPHIQFVFTENGTEVPSRSGFLTFWLPLPIEENNVSTGGGFNTGKRSFKVVIVSKEFTLGLTESNYAERKEEIKQLYKEFLEGEGSEGSSEEIDQMFDEVLINSYVKEFTFTFDITKKELSLAQTPTVTKEYDGNKDLSNTYQNARVGTASPSVWIGSGLVAGDIVTISGNYDSAEIGARTLSLTAGGADGANYSLTGFPAGQIASVEFDFTGHLDTEEWVEDGVEAPQNNSFSEVFDGNYTNFAKAINDESNFGTRQGYIQTGWTFMVGEQVYPVDADHADELVSALLANGNQITLNAVWTQDNVTITVNYNKAQGSVSGESVQAPYSVPYFTGSLELSVTANNGYFFETYSVTGNAQHSAPDTGAKTGTISISQVREDITVQVDFALITISITASDGSHPDVELASDSDRWTDAHTFNKNTLTGTVATTLPQYTLAEKSYLLSGWKFEFGDNVGEKAITVLKDDGRSIWDIIGGESLSEDSLDVTVTALWEVDSISFTITHNNATITSVKVGDETIVGVGDSYTVHFGDTVVVNFKGNEGYKFSSASLEGKAEITPPENAGRIASITMTGLKQDGAKLTINMTSIVITINTVADVQPYSQIKGSDKVQYQINHTDLTDSTTLNKKISIFKTTQTGTYNQTGWTYGEGGQSVELNELLLDFIKSTYASENSLEEGALLDGDYELKKSLIAVWTAVEYTITLADPQNIATNLPQETITVSYGQPISGLVALSPNTGHTGWVNSWNTKEDGNGTTYQNGDNFQTPSSVLEGETKAEATLYAVWTQGEFTLTITHDDKVTAISYNNKPVTAGSAEKYLSGTTHTFTLTITDGYVIDEDETRYEITSTEVGGEALTITVSGDQIIVSNMSKVASFSATLNIVTKEETFRLNLDLRNGVESVSGAQQDSGTYYVNIDYRQAYNATALGSLIFTRTGYTPDKIMLGEKTIATYADGAWTVVSDTYTLTTDSTIDVTWTLNDGYYTVTMEDQKNNITYSAQDQTVANGKVTIDGSSYTLGDILPNGDIYVRHFFERQGGSQTADGTSSLVLRHVNQFGQYRFVLEIRDGVTNELVQIASKWAEFTISEAEMSWSKGSFTSYYSGTSNFYATTPGEDMGHALIGENKVSDATFGRVVFTGSDFNKGADKDIRVYLNITADLVANYSNVLGDGTSGYYLALTGAGEIVATPISFAINGGGFETGSQHEIVFDSVASTGVSTTSGVPLDPFTFSATFVTDRTTGAITSFNLKENSNTVLLSGRSVDKDNFTWTATGSYTISKASKTITLSGKVLSTGEDLTDAQNTITLSDVMYGAGNVDLGNSAFYNHVVNGSAVFTISGNGSESVVIALGAGINISFDATTSKLAGFGLLAWTGDKTIATLKTTLQTLPKEKEYLQSYSSADIEKIYAVYTDLKYVRANYGYGENQGADYYVQIGQSTTLTEPSREGFNFVRWQAGAGVSVEGNKLSVASGETILPSSVTAIWEIADPTTATNNKELEFDAQYGANKEITLADVAGSIKNQSSDLTYTYRWLKEGEEVAGNVDKIEIARNTTASGNYTLEITASLPGYTSKTTTVNFTVKINKIALTAGNLSANEGTYKHADFASEVTIGVTVGSGEAEETPYTISSHLAKENFWFEVRLGSEEVGQIFNVGTYTITLKGDDTVYNVTANSATFEVKIYEYELKAEDVTGLGKFFGEEDPKPISITKVFEFGADNTESVQVNFTRTTGETVGNYEVEVASFSSTGNYSITAPEGNDFFEIRKAEGRLNITFDSPEALTKVYNGAISSISVTFDREDQKWTLSISDSASTTVSSGLTLKVYNNGREYDLSGIALENAFTGISFTFGEGVSAKNANTYPISVKVATEGTVNYQEAQIINPTSFVIGKANLVVSGITKKFDTTKTFSQQINGVGEEKVTVTGQFAKETVGSDIELNSVAILASETGNVNNYTISEIQTGSITPSNEANFDFAAGVDEFTYGDLRADDSLQTILEKLGAYVFTIGSDYTGAIEAGYAQITSADYGTKTVSKGGYLIAGGNKVTLTITSENYAQLASGKTFEVSISITPKALDLSGTQISKEYDQTDALPAGIVWSMQGNLSGDDVTVDESASKFENASVADDKKISIVLKGNDKGNYSVADEDMPKGNITPNSINITVDGTTLLDRDFSSITSVDGGKVNIPSPSFNVEYTDKVNGQSILDSFRAPTRVGFTPSGWYYLSGEEYIQITAENMQSVLDGAFGNNKAVTIYAGWTIDRLDITLSVTNGTASVSAEESANLVDNKDDTYTINYFSTITVKVTGAEGYKLDNITYSGNAQAFTPTGVGTKNDGQATISQIRTGGTITITMEEIMINVTVNGNTPAFVDEVTVSGDSWKDFEESIAYNSADTKASTFLPQWSAPAGTYNFAGYTYGEGSTSVAEQTLQDIVGQANKDVNISFTASWTGVKYSIHFNVTENGSLSGEETIDNLVFGQELDFDFPVATLSGRVSIWNTSADGEGRVYGKGSYLQDVGTLSQDVYVLELYTVWANRTSTLTINVGENVTRVLAGRDEVTPENKTFELEYGVDSLIITVTLNAGYELSYDYPEEASNEIVVSGNTITISNMADNRELTIKGTARTNTLTLNMTNATVEKVNSGTQGTGVVTAPTGDTVSITFAPTKGYSFVDGQSTISLSGRGKIQSTYQAGKVTVTWSDFTGDASLTVSSTPNKNEVTFSDNSAKVTSIWANGQSVSVTGGSAVVLTGETLTIVINLRYGYHNASLTLPEGITVTPQDETFDDQTRTYRRSFTITGIDENVAVTISASEREYSVQSISENADLGSVGSDDVVTMKFGSSHGFTATASEGYVFAGWYIGDTLISTDNPYTFFANESAREYLENNLTDGVLQLVAHFGLAESEVTITNGVNGTLTYNWGGEEDEDKTLVENDATTGIVSFGNKLVISVKPNIGYSVTSDSIKFTKEGQPVEDAWTKYVQPDEDGSAVITIPVEAGVPDKIEVTYVANDIEVYVQGVLIMGGAKNYGTNVGGQILLTNEEGEVVDWATENTYLDPNDEIGLVEGGNYRLATKTDTTLYFKATIKEGYTFFIDTDIIPGMPNAVINEISRTANEVFFSISRVSEGLRIRGMFEAQSNLVTVKFQTEDGTGVPAGAISVDTSSPLINAPINNSSSIYFYAVTSAKASFTINIGFNYSLKMTSDGIATSISEGLADKVTFGEVTDPGFNTGFTQRVKVDVNSIDSNGEIIIYVTPKIYNLNFVSEGKVLASISGITYGQIFSIPQDVLSKILVEREGFSLLGYYTYEEGQGTRYVNEDGTVPSGITWNESGYSWNGTTYVVSSNFDQATQTFSLYAGWSFDKEKVTIDFIPPELEGLVEISIKDIIYNLGADTSWTYANDNYYAEILEGVEIGLRAYPFEGFTFVKWIVNRDGHEVTHTTEEINYISEPGNVTITAVYRLNFTLSVDNGGTVALWQAGSNLGADGAFDPSEDISLVATESRGYNFVGWFTADGEAFGEKGVEKVNSDGTSTWTYTFTPSLQPLSLKAVFEGDEVGIIVDSTSLTGFGSILSFKVNGTEQDISSEITARVGSQIQIQVESEYGYGVIWEGVTPKYDISTQTYVYTVLAEDLTSYEGALHKNVILLKPVGTSSHISFRFDVRMGDDSQSTENAGSLVYRDPEGISHEITTGYVIEEILYGNTFFLEVVLQPNYRVGYVAIVAQGIHILDYDTIGSGFNPVSSRIEIQTSILNQFKPDLSEEISVIINFERDIWTDYSSEELSGAGTEADPYIIATNEDLAFMAYMINNEGNEHYASAYYLLVDNLDMTGKFWEPIGTEENPFAGTFNFDVYTIENLEHYMVYSNPTTSYNGLFWFMTDDAQILITNNALIIGLSVAGGIILLVLLILLIILLVRRRNKKKMEELANS